MKVKFLYGPADGAEVLEEEIPPEELPECVVFPDDSDLWGDLAGPCEAVYLLTSVRFTGTDAVAEFTFAVEVPYPVGEANE